MNDAFLLYLEQFFIREAIRVSEDSKDCSNLFMFCSINSNCAYLLFFSSPFKRFIHIHRYPFEAHFFIVPDGKAAICFPFALFGQGNV